MELRENVIVPQLFKAGVERFALVAGQKLVVETSPSGEDILSAECPAGKAWNVRVIVEIHETNA